MNRFIWMASAFAGAVLALVVGQASAQTQQFKMGAGLAGTYPIYSAKFADLINKNVPGVQIAAVSIGSLEAQFDMQKGELQFKIGYAFDVKRISEGLSAVPTKTPDVCHLQMVFGDGLYVVAKKDSPINSLNDLTKGRYRVWVGPKTGFFYNIINPLMEAHGMKLEDLEKTGTVLETFGYGDTAQAFQDRRLDVTFFSGGVPYSLMMQIENQPGFKFIKISPEVMKKFLELRPGVTTRVVAKNTYKGQEEDVTVPWYANQVIATTKLPEEIQYQITKVINEKAKDFHGIFPGSEEIGAVDPLAGNQVQICKGAERYYRAIGKLKS
ncbi:MAG: TAXI family TRAP transporter solute-binding subunit [Alphaproteobacteria bacterium]|nr:TAXI family TRAP transporter solute-binding subunit [Alphaproteobacteria bacterium]